MHRKWWTLLVVCVATFMLLLDITIVNVALPSIQKSLHASFQDLQWVVDAYSLTLAALLLTAGSLADLLGRKRVFILGLLVFTGASLLCGLANRPVVLNLSRGLQGIGGGVVFSPPPAPIAPGVRRGGGCSTCPCPATPLSGACRSPRSRSRPRCSRCSSTSRSTTRTSCT